jgi:Catechol dioxygenase N terminus
MAHILVGEPVTTSPGYALGRRKEGPMIINKQQDVTPAVLAEIARAPDPRFREIMSAFVRHLHDFAREV